MATTSASRWAAFTRRTLGVTAVASVALVALAVPASAHSGTPSAKCTDDGTVELKIDLVDYLGHGDWKPNTIKVWDGEKTGTPIISESFGKKFNLDADELAALKLDATVAHTFNIEVRAADDISLKHAPFWSFDKTLQVEKCKEEPPTEEPPTEEPPTEEPPTEEPPTEEPPAATPTTTTPAAVGVNANLAETGASIALPIGIGALLLIGGAGLLLVLRRRDKA